MKTEKEIKELQGYLKQVYEDTIKKGQVYYAMLIRGELEILNWILNETTFSKGSFDELIIIARARNN